MKVPVAMMDYITDDGAGSMEMLVTIHLGTAPGQTSVIAILEDPTGERESLVEEFNSFSEALDTIKSFFPTGG